MADEQETHWEENNSDDPAEELTEEQLNSDPIKKMLRAAETGNVAVIEKLITQSAALVNSSDSDGYTPLHRAAYSHQLAALKLLLASGANIESRTHDGWTPLHSAANWGNVHEVDELLDRGAKVNALTKGRQTPLHLAVANSQSHETISVLLSHPELDVTLRNKQGETARDLAMRTRFHTLFH